MKRALISSAVAIALGSSFNLEAGTAGLTGVWTGTYIFSAGSAGGGSVGASTTPQSWTWDFDTDTLSITNTQEWFTDIVWSVDDVVITDNNDGTYSGVLYWRAPNYRDILYDMIWDVSEDGTVNTIYGLVHDGFFGPPTVVYFDGYISQVPIPSAVWLFGSGLISLIGLARRKA